MAAASLEGLKSAILGYDAEKAKAGAEALLASGVDPIVVVDAMTDAIREVGDGFERGEMWLPDLVGAANAMKAALPPVEAAIASAGKQRETLGSVVIGTVFGDIHDIGKNMVATLLLANGFTVHDLGINITAEGFLDAIRQHQPDIVALSALMTMTAQEQVRVIQGLEREGLRDRVKVMVGGGAITQDFAVEIGADGYEASAPGAVELARRWCRS